MEQQTYEITAPNGKVLSITGDHVPTESELHDIFAKAGVDTGAKPEPHLSAARPGTAYSTDTKGAIAQLNNGVLDPNTREQAQTFLTTPLAHPTGIPPIDSVTSPIGLLGAGVSAATVYKALTGPAASAVGRALAAARAAGQEITPVLKYELTKTTLEKLHVPTPIAMAAGVMLSGYRGNGKPARAPAEAPPVTPPESVSGGTPPPAGPPAVAAPAESPVAAPAAATPASPPPTSRPAAAAAPPVEAPVAAPAPGAASPAAAPPSRQADTVGLSAAQRTKGQMSPTWIQSDLGMAARRQGLTLSPAEYAAAEAAVRDHAVSPAQAVQAVGKLQTQGPPAPSTLKLSAEEATQFDVLRRSGKSGAEAEAAILKLRTLAKKLKTPSGAQVEDAVQKRNETGRWDE